MGKPKRERALGANEAKAQTRTLHISPQKLNLVAQLIRGKRVSTALADLTFSRKRIARDVKKTLESAVANAEHNHALDAEDLYISEAFADEGPTLKRFRPRARGRATRIDKRTSHITIVVDDMSELDEEVN